MINGREREPNDEQSKVAEKSFGHSATLASVRDVIGALKLTRLPCRYFHNDGTVCIPLKFLRPYD